jgi:hypothetical protein
VRSVLVVVGILLLCSTVWAEAPAPRVEVPEQSYNAGTIDAGMVIRHTFALKNVGSADLHLEVQPGCACTVVQFDKTIAPGAVGTITATLDTLNYQGRIVKEVRVASDDPSNGSLGLQLRADVVPALALTPSAPPLLQGRVAELKPVDLVLASNDGKPFDVVRVNADPVLAVHVAPDAGAVPARTRYVVTIGVKPDVPAGRSGPIVTLVTSHPHAPPLTIRVHLVVAPEVVVTPKHVMLRASAPQDARHVRIAKAAGGLAILGVDSSDANVVATVTPIVTDHEYDLAVRYTAALAQGLVRAQVTVRTNDPGQHTIVIAVVARP